MEKFKTTAPVYTNLGVDFLPQPYEDASIDGVKYFGWAPLGVDENDAGWRIMKETIVDGITKRQYAEGSMEFSFIWSERLNYVYSH